jgi:hypothetical protein
VRGASRSLALVSVGSILLVGGCGGSSLPTSANGPLLRVLSVVSGGDEDPVTGATLVVGGHAYQTDGSGHVSIPESGAADLDVQADNYLLRQTRLNPTDKRVVLWPLGPGYRSEYVRSLIYKPSYTTSDVLSSADDVPSHHVTAGRVSLVPSAGIQGDAAAVRALDAAVAEMNAVTEGHLAFTVDTRPVGTVTFRLSVDSSIASAALTWRDVRASSITGGRICFQSFAGARDPHYVTHELGHVLGLEHSLVPSDMMYFLALPTSPRHFTENERISIRLLLQRPPGNRYPDNDRDGIATANAATGSSVAVD